MQERPKKYRCTHCHREQNTQEFCYDCYGDSFVKITNSETDKKPILRNEETMQ